MKQPDIVIGHFDNQAEILDNPKNVDCLIIHFDVVDEYGEPEEKEKVDELIKEGKWAQLSEFLAGLEEKISNEGGW